MNRIDKAALRKRPGNKEGPLLIEGWNYCSLILKAGTAQLPVAHWAENSSVGVRSLLVNFAAGSCARGWLYNGS